jgi:hypothetical protein
MHLIINHNTMNGSYKIVGVMLVKSRVSSIIIGSLQLLSIVDPVAVTRLLVVLFAKNPQMITRSAILTYVSISVVKSFR